MVNYKNGKIYKLTSDNSNLVYYGSTTKKLYERKAGHLHDYKKYQEGKMHFISSFEVIECGNVNCVLVENFPCDDKSQLHEREKYYIKNNECVNKQIPNRSQKEWGEDNKEHIKKYYKKYCLDNKEKLNKKACIRQRKHYEKIKHKLSENFDCECGGRYTRRHKQEHERSKKHINFINSK